VIETLLRAAGGAASFTLGSLWPMRWPAFPVAFFDFDMFNEPADRLWEESKARCADLARDLDAQAREVAAQTAIPQTVMPSTVTVYDRFIAAVIAGDLGTAIELADECTQFSRDLAELIGIDLTDVQTSATETERPATNASADPSVVDGPEQTLPPGCSGPTNFTAGELEDAAYAVRRHITDRVEPTSVIGAEAWTHLAEKLEAAAVSK